MKNSFVVSFLSIFLFSCLSLNEKISVISYSEAAAEYPYLLNRLVENKNLASTVQADTFTGFLDKISPCYRTLFADNQRAKWLMMLGIGDKRELDKAENNLGYFCGNNIDMFWKLRNGIDLSKEIETMQVRLWEDFFCKDKIKIGGRGSAQISYEIARIEDEILKSNKGDIKELLKHESQFSRLFSIRNDLARVKGFPDHLHYVLKANEIEEYDALHKAMLTYMPKEIPAPENIRGLVNSTLPLYLDLTLRFFNGFGLEVNKNRIKYFITKEVKYNKTFFSMIEPNGEGRIYISLVEAKLFPDEFIGELDKLVHETGHAIHFQSLDEESLIFNFLDPTIAETVAIFFENILYARDWLSKSFPGKLTDSEISAIVKNRKISVLEMLRYSSFLWKFEKSIYENPEQNLNELYARYSKEVNMKRERQFGIWFDTSIFASHDLYYNYYAFGFLYAYKLHKLMVNKFGHLYFENPDAGKFLIENVLGYGRSIPSRTFFNRIFGNDELPVREYLQYLTE